MKGVQKAFSLEVPSENNQISTERVLSRGDFLESSCGGTGAAVRATDLGTGARHSDADPRVRPQPGP